MTNNNKYFLVSFLYQLLLIILIVFFWWRNGTLFNSLLLTQRLKAWDSHHYLYISNNGYVESGDEANFIVFFPLYPLAINLVNQLIKSDVISALVISNIASILGHYFLIKTLIKLKFSKKFIVKTILLVFFNPLSVYFFNIYTEGLFYLLSVLFFYFLSSKKYSQAIFFGFLASLTRMTGFLLFFPFLYQVFIVDKKKDFLLFLKSFAIGFGMIIYFFVNFIVFNTFFKFLETQKNHWGKEAKNPIINIISNIRQLVNNGFPDNFTFNIDVLTTLLFLVFFFIYLFKKKKLVPISWLIWIFMQWLMVASQSFWLSNARYIFMMFPIYPLIVDLLGKNRVIYYLFLSVSLLLFTKGIYLYSLSAWLY